MIREDTAIVGDLSQWGRADVEIFVTQGESRGELPPVSSRAQANHE